MMSLKDYLLPRYGPGVHAAVSNFKKLRCKIAITKNKIIFLRRCLHHGITPKFLRNRCPIKSKRAETLTMDYQRKLLKNCESTEKKIHFSLIKKYDEQESFLKNKLNEADFLKISDITKTAHEREFLKKRSELKRKLVVAGRGSLALSKLQLFWHFSNPCWA